VADRIALFFSLLSAGVLAGNELGTWAVAHPAVRRLRLAEEMRAEQEVTRRYGYFMPGLMILAVVSTIVAAGLNEELDPRWCLFAAAACFAVMLAITLAGNVPINIRTLRFDPAGETGEWRRLRRRWDLLHTARIVLDVAAFVLLLVAAV